MFEPQVIVFFVPIVAIVMGIGIGMLAIIVNYLKRKHLFTLHHQERMAAIEKGIDVPPLPDAFFTEDGNASPRSPHRSLLTGLVLLFLGLALMLALYVEVGSQFLWGLIPAAVGLAYLIYYFAVGRKLAALMLEERKARLAETVRNQTPTA